MGFEFLHIVVDLLIVHMLMEFLATYGSPRKHIWTYGIGYKVFHVQSLLVLRHHCLSMRTITVSLGH